MASEAELMRTCAPLYAPIALESFANICLFLCFMYLFMLIQSRGEVKNPGLAFARLVKQEVMNAVLTVWNHLMRWPDMPNEPLMRRFALCRKLNASMCFFTACVALLATTRWLHIGNVNGFRYLGYSFTCPIMQAELIMMLAPVMPCYKLNVIVVATMTFSMMITGYAASLLEGTVYDGSFLDFVNSWDLDDLAPTTKFYILLPSMVFIMILTFIQLPCLALLYIVKGGVSGGLPKNYLRLLMLVAVTWWGFPVWWWLNWQGMGIIEDAKLNGIGFCVLNLISKGAFTLMFTGAARWHKQQKRNSKIKEDPSWGEAGSLGSLGTYASEGSEDDQNDQNAQAPPRRISHLASATPGFINILTKYDKREGGDNKGAPDHELASTTPGFVSYLRAFEEGDKPTRAKELECGDVGICGMEYVESQHPEQESQYKRPSTFSLGDGRDHILDQGSPMTLSPDYSRESTTCVSRESTAHVQTPPVTPGKKEQQSAPQDKFGKLLQTIAEEEITTI